MAKTPYEHVVRGANRGPRRLAQIHVSPDQLLGWLSWRGTSRVSIEGLPDDARLVNCGYDFFTHTIALTVEHESLPEVEEGMMLPELRAMVTFVSAPDHED